MDQHLSAISFTGKEFCAIHHSVDKAGNLKDRGDIILLFQGLC